MTVYLNPLPLFLPAAVLYAIGEPIVLNVCSVMYAAGGKAVQAESG